jgi:hypothetical protein
MYLDSGSEILRFWSPQAHTTQISVSWSMTSTFSPRTAQMQKRRVPPASPSDSASNEKYLDEI